MARVLRLDQTSTRPAFSFEDLEGQGREIVDRARQEAGRILADAEQHGRQRAAQLEEEGHLRGLEAGRREGLEQVRQEAAATARAEAREQLDRLSQALTSALESVEDDRRRLLATAERGLLALALAIARRVCKHDVGSSSDAARANARHLLEMVKHDEDLKLHLNPDECEALRQAAPELSTSVDQLAHVEIVSDPTVERGGCVLHTRDGVIDAGVDTQLDAVAAALLKQNDDEAGDHSTDVTSP